MMCDHSDSNNRQRLLSISSNPSRSKCCSQDKTLPSCHIGRNSIHIQVPRSSLALTIDESSKRDNDTINYGIKLDNLSNHQYSYWKASSEDLNREIERYMNSLHSTLDVLDNIPTQYAYSKSNSTGRPSAPIASQLWGQVGTEGGYESGRSSYNSSSHSLGHKSLSNHSPNTTIDSDNEDDSEDDPPEIATSCHNLPTLLPRPLHLMPPIIGTTKTSFSLSRQGGALPSLVTRCSPTEDKKEIVSPEAHVIVDSPSSDTIMIQQRFPNLPCRVPYGVIAPMKATPLRHSLHSAFKPARINHPYVAFAKSH